MLILVGFSGGGARCLTRDHHSTVRPDKDRSWRGTTGQLAAFSGKSPTTPLLALWAFFLPQHWTKRPYSVSLLPASYLSITTHYQHSLRR